MATAEVAPLLVIVGETASGKSELALKLAQEFNGEIICADSSTVRREADIGNAKPSASDRKLVPHHLLDVVGPNEEFTAATFKRLANQAIDDIHSRGRLPIMVGGTGLYIDGVLYDYSFLPSSQVPEVRQRLNGLSLDELMAEVAQLGLDVKGVDTRNKRRLIRLIETNGVRPSRKAEIRQYTLILGLRPEREELKHRILERVEVQIANGLIDEVQALVNKYGWDCEVLKGIGYSQWRAYFEGHESLDGVRAKIAQDTLDLAKRQRTWFKRNKSIHWFDAPVKWQNLVDLVTTIL